MDKIAAVIVTYNRKELLVKSIASVLRQTKGNPDVLVIDNASTDMTQDTVKELYENDSRVKYYNTGSNLGGAGGFSYGINYAVNLGYEYIWIMDDDTYPDECALENLLGVAEKLDGEFGFLSSYVKWTDGSSCVMNIPTLCSKKWRCDIPFHFENRIIPLESTSFVSMFFSSNVVREVGLPIKEFFIWADDVEYSERISSRYASYFVYDSQVVHAIKSNIGTSIVDEEDEQRLTRYRYLYRNKHYIAKRKSKRARLFLLFEVKNTVRDIMKSTSSKKWQKVKIVVASYLSGAFFNPQIDEVYRVD